MSSGKRLTRPTGPCQLRAGQRSPLPYSFQGCGKPSSREISGRDVEVGAAARSRLFHYIWDYNHHRLHSALDHRRPADHPTLNT